MSWPPGVDKSSYAPLFTTDQDAPDKERMSARALGLEGVMSEMNLSQNKCEEVLAGAKLLAGLEIVNRGYVGIEQGSVYGLALLLPQLARSLGYPRFLTALMVRSFVFLVVCIFLHASLLMYLAKEVEIMGGLAGTPHLCDFGTNVDNCQFGGHGCMGPGGSEMRSPARLYNFGQWSERNFFRDSLLAAVPEKADRIKKLVDPGEFGAESHYCRLVCCFVLFMIMAGELALCFEMIELLWRTPTEAEPWIELLELDDQDTIDHWLDHIKVKVAGMPAHWKVFNVCFLFCPKLCLWYVTAVSGVTFLMETDSIDSVIINSVALIFLLNIDNLIVESLASVQARHLVENCEPLPGYEDEQTQPMTASDILHQHIENQRLAFHLGDLLWRIFPGRALWIFILTFFFVYHYYTTFCERIDGAWVSKTVYTPTTLDYNLLNRFFAWAFPIEFEHEPAWTMPE